MPTDKRTQPHTAALVADLVLPGKPMTMARARFSRNGPTYTPDDRRGRMGDFAQAWVDQKLPKFGKGVYLCAEFFFVFPRPESHFGTGRNSHLLRPTAAKYPGRGAYGGDLDNLEKLVEDALTGVAYFDDSQIVEKTSMKRFVSGDEFPHTQVRLEVLGGSG